MAFVAVASCLPRWLLLPEDQLSHTLNNFAMFTVMVLCIIAAWYSSTDEA